MKEFLKKIKLIDNFFIELPIKKNDLMEKIENFVDDDYYDLLEGFRSCKKKYKGRIDINGFEIRRKLSSTNNTKGNTIAYGNFDELNDKTKVEIEIIGFDTFHKIFYCFLIFFWGIMIFILIAYLKSDGAELSDFGIMFVIILLLTILPYFQMKNSVEQMRYDLELEFFYLTKK